MRYVSTRSDASPLSFEEAVFAGLAPDGGLYIPVSIPIVTPAMLQAWSKLGFQELALELFSMYIDPREISRKDLNRLINESFHYSLGDDNSFSHPCITPLRLIDAENDIWLLELFHGPTLAFKDVALQFLGNLFEYFLGRKNQPEPITVVGATSGDTGSAAIYGLKGKENIQVVILHPKERISFIQERQMTTVLDDNIHNIAIEGTFDDCQDIVKTLFRDAVFRKRHRLAAINSINWARILAQITYYFYAFFRVQEYHHEQRLDKEAEEEDKSSASVARAKRNLLPLGPRKSGFKGFPWRKVQFSVPTGNFGNVLAGYYARCMGLPIETLVIGTNINDVLYRFFSSGTYSKSSLLIPTLTPAMDIQISSNFERLLYHTACEGNYLRLGKLFKQFNESGSFTLEAAALARVREGFRAFRVDEDLVIDCIQKYYFRAEPKKESTKESSLKSQTNNANNDAYGAAIAAVSAGVTSTPENTCFRLPVPLDAKRPITTDTGPILLDPHTAVGVIAGESFIYQQQRHPIDEIQLDLKEIENVAFRQEMVVEANALKNINVKSNNGNSGGKSQVAVNFVKDGMGLETDLSTICISTAHPFKFPEAICNSINPFAFVTEQSSSASSLLSSDVKASLNSSINEVKRRGHTVISILGGMFYTMFTMLISPIFQVSSRVKYPPSHRFSEAQLQSIESFYLKINMLPVAWKGLYKRPIRCATLPNSAQSVKLFIQQLSEISLYSGGTSTSTNQESSSSLMSRL